MDGKTAGSQHLQLPAAQTKMHSPFLLHILNNSFGVTVDPDLLLRLDSQPGGYTPRAETGMADPAEQVGYCSHLPVASFILCADQLCLYDALLK